VGDRAGTGIKVTGVHIMEPEITVIVRKKYPCVTDPQNAEQRWGEARMVGVSLGHSGHRAAGQDRDTSCGKPLSCRMRRCHRGLSSCTGPVSDCDKVGGRNLPSSTGNMSSRTQEVRWWPGRDHGQSGNSIITSPVVWERRLGWGWRRILICDLAGSEWVWESKSCNSPDSSVG